MIVLLTIVFKKLAKNLSFKKRSFENKLTFLTTVLDDRLFKHLFLNDRFTKQSLKTIVNEMVINTNRR